MTKELKEIGQDIGHPLPGSRLQRNLPRGAVWANPLSSFASKRLPGDGCARTAYLSLECANTRQRRTAITSSTSHRTYWIGTSQQQVLTGHGPVTLPIFGRVKAGFTWLYLAVIHCPAVFPQQTPRGMDLHSWRVIGWAASNRMKRDLTIRALKMAIALRAPPKGCIHHTDRGSKFCSHDYQKIFRQRGFRASPSYACKPALPGQWMSGKGNCYDCEYGIAA
jgi:transposase InsO family protein